jgi:hypothetical protein
MSDCEQVYEPNKSKDGLDEHVERTNSLSKKVMGIFAAIAFAMVVASVLLSPGDPMVMVRWLVSRFIRVFFADMALLCVFQFVQVYTNGNALKRILQDPRSCAYWLSAVFIVNGLCLIGG